MYISMPKINLLFLEVQDVSFEFKYFLSKNLDALQAYFLLPEGFISFCNFLQFNTRVTYFFFFSVPPSYYVWETFVIVQILDFRFLADF